MLCRIMRFAACLSQFSFLPSWGFACECGADDRVGKAAETATAVFIGKVTDIRESSTYFQIEKTLKGDKGARTLIIHPSGNKNCDFEFRSEGEYFVFADGPKQSLTVSKCSPTSEWGRERFFPADKDSGFRLSVYQIGIFCALILAGILLYSNFLPRRNKRNG